ncbi:MAG: CPBP family intramembrane glutamic endopeptidase [Gemmatimonadota bacterium]
MPGLVDHLIALTLVVLAPLYAARTYKKLAAKLENAGPGARIPEYRGAIVRQWLACLTVAAVWIGMSRSVSDLGLTFDGGTRRAVGVSITSAILLLLAFQWVTVLKLRGEALERAHLQLESVKALLPRTEAEYRTFQLLALTAGICEEVLYRGFLIWYFGAFIGTWPAVIAAAAAFGIAHFYQGAGGVLKTALAGALTGALYVVSGSLLWPMIVHAAVDLHGGAVGFRLLGRPAA